MKFKFIDPDQSECSLLCEFKANLRSDNERGRGFDNFERWRVRFLYNN